MELKIGFVLICLSCVFRDDEGAPLCVEGCGQLHHAMGCVVSLSAEPEQVVVR